MVLEALHNVGGVTYLEEQALKQPGPFLALVGKMAPFQVAGPSGGALAPRRVIIELQDGAAGADET
mgnify:CR=1 FL=1